MRAGVCSRDQTTWTATSPTVQPESGALSLRSAFDREPTRSVNSPRASSRSVRIWARMGSALSCIGSARLFPGEVSVSFARPPVHALFARRPGLLEEAHGVRHEAPKPALSDRQVRLVGHVGTRKAPRDSQEKVERALGWPFGRDETTRDPATHDPAADILKLGSLPQALFRWHEAGHRPLQHQLVELGISQREAQLMFQCGAQCFAWRGSLP